MGKESGDDDVDDDVDEHDEEEEGEQEEGEVVVGLGLELLHGELGADLEVGCGQFSSVSSMWMMADREEGRRLERASVPDRLGVLGSVSGWWTEMALRRQLSHCCLWKTSFTCSVWDWAWLGSWERTRKMFLAAEKEE